MADFRNIRDPRRLNDGSGGYAVTVDLDLGEGWETGPYTVRPGRGGLSNAVMAAIIAGEFAGQIADDAPAPRQPPASLQRAAFWLYALTLGVTRDAVHAQIDALLAANQLTPDHAARLRIKIDDAASYERADPDLLLMAQAMGIAADQAALDAHFLAAVSG